MLRVLEELDFIHIAYQSDQYAPEVETILPRLPSARDSAAVRRILHEEFVYWFSSEDAGPEERFDKAAEKIWSIWRAHADAQIGKGERARDI